ncbi:MAG: tetratricopeptide repeat protein [Myxococcota bacterium]
MASDGSLALVADLERRVYRVWGPDPAAPGPLRSAPFAARPGAVILGVRYHRDLAPIVARACAATCDNERCTAALPARDCDALEREKDYPCEYGPDAPGDDGDDNVIGAEPDAPDLDARARALTGSASDLGNRCFRQLQAAELDEARATCAEALRRKPSDATRGAILFNLGLIAEKRGDPAEARRLYRESLAARPNATVRKRLDALGP